MSDKKPTDFRARWDDLRRECEALENDNSTKGLGACDPRVLDQEAQIAANNTLRWEAAEAAWATCARDLPDLLLLAEIAYDQFFDLRAFPSLPAEDSDNHQKIAVACLIRGIADVARVKRSADPTHDEAASADAHAAGTARLLAAWRAAVPGEIAALEASNDLPPNAEAERVYQQALGRMRDLAAEAWARPVAAWADVRLRAEIGHHALYADYHGDGARRFEAVLAGKQPAEDQLTLGTFDERAVAELLKAVMWAPAALAPAVAGSPAAARPVPQTTPIANVALEIVRFHEAYDALDAADADEEQLRKAFGRTAATSQGLLALEPETADDTLSLVLVAAEALGTAIDNNSEAANVGELQRVEAALEAAIRGLVRSGARSPLFERYTAPADRP